MLTSFAIFKTLEIFFSSIEFKIINLTPFAMYLKLKLVFASIEFQK